MSGASLPTMDIDDWHKRWEEGRTMWQKTTVDPVLEKYIGLLEKEGVAGGQSILVTMCGKSLDVPWLCSRGHSVTATELSPLAVRQLFTENSIPYTTSEKGPFCVHTATDLDLKVFCGDMFGCHELGLFDAIWDCNAIVSINVKDRAPYVELLSSFLKPNGRILMTTWNYEQKLYMNRPFDTPPELIQELFPNFDLRVLEKIDMAGTDFIKWHKLPWLLRPVLFMTPKSRPVEAN